MAASSSLLTRCPHCDTRFRVSGEQLDVAGGKVRCGHCLEVFDAHSHAADGSPASDEKPSVEEGRQDQDQSTQEDHSESFSATEPDDELIFQDNPEEDAAEGQYAGQSLTFSDDELSDNFRDVGEPGSSQGDNDDSDIEDVDESWAEAMLQEELPDTPKRNGSSSSIRNTSTEAPATDTTAPDSTAATKSPDHDQQQHRTAAAEAREKPAKAAEKPETGPESETPEPGDLPSRDDHDSPQKEAGRASSTSGFAPLDNLSAYDELSREPVSVPASRRSGLRGWLWSLVLLALLAVLVSQVAYFQFDRLAAIPELRGWYEKACEYAGCELEPLIAMDRIQSRKLVVRTDPENRNALLVGAVIINQAEFEQPFPAIALTFSNLNGDVVAQSIFSPEEYLAGEGAGLEAMSPGTPVRIAISIRDPGRDAVNYNLRFVNRRD